MEVTNRCNAGCSVCPRDQTPHEGLMSPEVFHKGLERADEYRGAAVQLDDTDVHISLCGLGNPLINKHIPERIRAVNDNDFVSTMSSNGALLAERRGDHVHL